MRKQVRRMSCAYGNEMKKRKPKKKQLKKIPTDGCRVPSLSGGGYVEEDEHGSDDDIGDNNDNIDETTEVRMTLLHNLVEQHETKIAELEVSYERDIAKLQQSHNQKVSALKDSHNMIQALLLEQQQQIPNLRMMIQNEEEDDDHHDTQPRDEIDSSCDDEEVAEQKPQILNPFFLNSFGDVTSLVPEAERKKRSSDQSTELLNFISTSNVKEQRLENCKTTKYYHDEIYANDDDDDGGGGGDDDNKKKKNIIVDAEKLNLPQHTLPEDTYSFIMIASRYTRHRKNIQPMLLSWFVVAFQLISYTLVLINSVDLNEKGNILGFPHSVPKSTQFAEIVALIVTCLNADDTRHGILFLSRGYFQCIFYDQNTGVVNKDVLVLNWHLSVWFRFFQGTFYVFVSIILIMQADNVIDLLLNFSAMQFLADLDNVAFYLASQGFMGNTNKEKARQVSETCYYVDHSKWHPFPVCTRNLERTNILSTLTFIIILIPLLGIWSVIRANQIRGAYSCKTVFVQLGSGRPGGMSTLSGYYKHTIHNGRVLYELDVDDNIGTAHFRYCRSKKFWALTYSPQDEVPCENWVIRSSQSEFDGTEFDILSTASLTWFMRNDEDKEIILEHFRMLCFDCDKDDDVCGDNGSCYGHSDTCICDDGWYGDRCDFLEPCETIEISIPNKNFVGYREWSNTYTRLRKSNNGDFADLNGHPVYYAQPQSIDEFDLMFYGGRRWVLTSTVLMDDLEGVSLTKDTLIQYLEEEFHPAWSKFFWAFISDKVDIDTHRDAATPIGLHWFRLDDNELQSMDIVFVCNVCDDETNPCLEGGVCQTHNRRCDCSTNGASGALCQIPPDNNGFCDPVFNTPRFNFDGGDCCQATCESGDFTCGWDKMNEEYKHYCDCTDPVHNCPDGISTCWQQNSESIVGEIKNAESGKSIALSFDARILAVGEPGGGAVRVFQNDGLRWLPLGNTLRGDVHSSFGESIAISGDGFILAVGSPVGNYGFTTDNKNQLEGHIDVFEFRNKGEDWKKMDEIGADMIFSETMKEGRFGANLAISADGRIIFCSVQGARGTAGIFAYEATQLFSQSIPFKLDDQYLYHMQYWNWGEDFSISNSGQVLAFHAADDTRSDVFLAQYRPPRTLGNFTAGSFVILEDASVPGCCPLLSWDGRVLVVAIDEKDPPQCQAYDWEDQPGLGSSSQWVKRGEAVIGTAKALSPDGLTLAVLGTNATILTFSWDGRQWTNRGDAMGGYYDASVLLSRPIRGDDRVMAVGLPSDNSMGQVKGQTFVYRFIDNNHTDDNRVERCKRGDSHVRIEIITDATPNETMWEIRDFLTKEIVLSGGPYHQVEPHSPLLIDVTLNDTSCNTFTIYDLGGDGLCCGNGLGSYSLSYGGLLEKLGGNFQWSERHRFGNCHLTCSEEETLLSVEVTTDNHPDETSWSLREQSSGSLFFVDGPYESTGKNIQELCIPAEVCYQFDIFDQSMDGICCFAGFGSYIVTYGEVIATRGGQFFGSESTMIGNCSLTGTSAQIIQRPQSETASSLFVNIIGGSSSSTETNWFLYKFGSRNMAASGNHSMYIDLDDRECYLFEPFPVRSNGQMDEYSLLLDGNEIVSGAVSGNFHLIGNCGRVNTHFLVNAGNSIKCRDHFSSSCTAPVSCVPRIEPMGKKVKSITLGDGKWKAWGGFSLAFENHCSLTCTGTCNTDAPVPFSCEKNESIIRFQLVPRSEMFWIVRTLEGEVILEGGQREDITKIVHDRACIPTDSCTIFELHGDSVYDLYLDGKYLLSGNIKGGFAAENVCPDLLWIPSSPSLALNGDDSALLPAANDVAKTVPMEFPVVLSSMESCHAARPLYLGELVQDSTANGTIHYVSKCQDTVGSASPGVWYSIVGDGNKLLASLCESEFDTQISVFSGSCDALVCVAGNDDYCGSQSRTVWNSISGTVYLLFVHGYGVDQGDYTLHVTEVTPVNDNCNEAVFLNLQSMSNSSISSFGATEFAEIDIVPFCGEWNSTSNNGSSSPGVWYAVTGTGREISATTCSSTTGDGISDYDTMISVFTGSCDALDCVTSNDNACGLQSHVHWTSIEGETYFILVHGSSHGESGQYRLDVQDEASTANAVCHDTVPLELNVEFVSSTTKATTTFANISSSCTVLGAITTEVLEEKSSSGISRRPSSTGVWFSVIGTGHNMEARTCSNMTTFDTVVTVYFGSCNVLHCVAQNDDFCGRQSVVTWSSLVDVKYFILVEGKSILDDGIFGLGVYEQQV